LFNKYGLFNDLTIQHDLDSAANLTQAAQKLPTRPNMQRRKTDGQPLKHHPSQAD
jgi:muconolactone delta-isomerase